MLPGSASAQLVTFARQFASMVASGLPLVAVLEDLARETPQRALRLAVHDVARLVSAGEDLGAAFARHPKLFDGVFVGLVRAGLESGQLAVALGHVADHLQRVEQTRRKVAAATLYPAVVLVIFTAVSAGMIFGILPQYESMFRSFDRALPTPTQWLLDLGAAIRRDGPLVGPLLGLLVGTALLFRATPRGRLAWDRGKLRLPIFGRVWRLATFARFSRTLAVQVGNQVPVVRSLRLAAAASGNRYIEDLGRAIADDVEGGAGLTRAFRERALFSGLVLQMVAAGEQSGRLDELLLSAATYFDSLLAQRIETVTGLVNPVLTATLGFSVAGMLIAAFLPVFDMPGALG